MQLKKVLFHGDLDQASKVSERLEGLLNGGFSFKGGIGVNLCGETMGIYPLEKDFEVQLPEEDCSARVYAEERVLTTFAFKGQDYVVYREMWEKFTRP